MALQHAVQVHPIHPGLPRRATEVAVGPADQLGDVAPLVLRNMRPGKDTALFTTEVFDTLRRHEWPGNVRELRNYVERCLVFEVAPPTGSERPRAADDPEPAPGAVDLDLTFRDGKERAIAEYERRYVTELIRWADGNLSRAARKAGMDRMNLYRVLQRHGMREQLTTGD